MLLSIVTSFVAILQFDLATLIRFKAQQRSMAIRSLTKEWYKHGIKMVIKLGSREEKNLISPLFLCVSVGTGSGFFAFCFKCKLIIFYKK